MVDKGVPVETIIQASSQCVIPALPSLEEKISIHISNLDHDCPPFRSEAMIGSDDEYSPPVESNPGDALEVTLWASEWYLLQSSLIFIKKNYRKSEESKGSFFVKFMDVGSLIKEEPKDAENIEQVLASLMRASHCAARCQAWKQLENVSKAV